MLVRTIGGSGSRHDGGQEVEMGIIKVKETVFKEGIICGQVLCDRTRRKRGEICCHRRNIRVGIFGCGCSCWLRP
jgi:hypothetical protein